MELRKSEVAGLYNILKEGQKVKAVASNCNLSDTYVRQMFNGKRNMSEEVWGEALAVADKYLNDIENGNKTAQKLIEKHQQIKVEE